jgi:hypothetical protein
MLKTADIKVWLAYWQAAHMVNVDAIQAYEHVHLARKFCSCMRVGVFADVSDLEIWRSLVALRQGLDEPLFTDARWPHNAIA